MKQWHRIVHVAGLALVASACSMPAAARKTPMASAVLSVPADLPNQRLFDCAESSIATLSETRSSWPKVTREDPAQGILESGDFPETNRSGFRLRMERPPGANQAKLALKGAGAYFVDLGVDQAMQAFKTALGRCVATQPQ
ncbi:hypothetical protein J7373_05850 [Xanthomonas sp. A2111]|uniref:Lipoprotein n=1 Tax=Xanthomonas hawaiiensis TaxID=3003247 RepID=A0ABU2I7L2_9XANT|nr:hypothetical protein [Xanthomonas sp. A2111]MBO9827772.1 hypothetical protein [Xanthomonas sp. A2111]MDS9994139.1 hypothetical protein [Xanthomonas sp. A2111]